MKVNALLGAMCIALTFHSCKATTRDATDIEGYITKDTANVMISSYLKSTNNIPGKIPPDVNSLIMDAGLLRDYLSNPDIIKVKVMLAHTLDYINSGNSGKPAGYRSDALTIVLAGYDKAGNYVYAKTNLVPNHATPCPRNCPDQGTASQSLLQ